MLSEERGFTLVEVLAAMSVLLVGVTATLTLILAAEARTASTKAREGGVNLQRELVEASRSIPYAQLTPGASSPSSSAWAGWRTRTRGRQGGRCAGGA